VEQTMFTNEVILSWLQYFSKNAPINLAKLKMLDITGKNKNLIPTVGLYGRRTSGYLLRHVECGTGGL
jgi:hypothetical protein